MQETRPIAIGAASGSSSFIIHRSSLKIWNSPLASRTLPARMIHQQLAKVAASDGLRLLRHYHADAHCVSVTAVLPGNYSLFLQLRHSCAQPCEH